MAAGRANNPLDYGTSTSPVYRSRRRWKLVLLFGGVGFLLLIALVLAGLWQMRNNIYFPWNPALRTLADNGATCIDDPDMNVRVLAIGMSGDEKQFGDRQLVAIIPAVSRIDHFNSLDLHGSSVTDAALGRLKVLTMLDELDVSDTPVTVNGLLSLRGLPGLHRITVSPGQLNPVEMQKLNAAFPRTIKTFRPSQAPVTATTGPSN